MPQQVLLSKLKAKVLFDRTELYKLWLVKLYLQGQIGNPRYISFQTKNKRNSVGISYWYLPRDSE
ncbi:2668_t:CDS:1, partial [Gigaspora rosea]